VTTIKLVVAQCHDHRYGDSGQNSMKILTNIGHAIDRVSGYQHNVFTLVLILPRSALGVKI